MATRTRYVNDSGANSFFVTTVTEAAFLLTQQDRYIIAHPSAAPTYTLPTTVVTGQRHTIIDDLAVASPTFPFTISGNGHSINSAEGSSPTYQMWLPRRVNTFEFNGTSWDVVETAGPITFLEGGAVTQRITWPLLHGVVATPVGPSTPQIIGSMYFDPTSPYAARTADAGWTANVHFKVIAATTNVANTAFVDLIDVNNVLGNGAGATVPGSQVQTSTTNQSFLTSSPSLSLTTPAGIFSARLWLSPTSAGQQAICYMAKIEVDYSIFAP